MSNSVRNGGRMVLAAIVGTVWGACLGITGLVLMTGVSQISNSLWFSLAASIPAVWGAVASVLGMALLTRRARYVDTFKRLLVEGSMLGAIAGLSIFALGSWQGGSFGPLVVLCVALIGGAIGGFLVTSILRPQN